MMLALLLSLLGSAPPSENAAPARALNDDPPIKVWLNQDNYFQRGDRARVHVKVAEDGYLVVLRADAEGRVRVLFPLDPSDDAFVRGGRTLEIRGRGDREAFYIDEREGSGVVLAARAVAPFKFDEFVRGDHWDYRVLDAREAGGDKEAALLDIVQRMAPDGHFDYDVQKYFVESPRAYRDAYYPGYSSFGLHLGFGWGGGWPYSRFGFAYGYGSCFDPFFYDPFFCGAAYYSPFFYDPFSYGYSSFFYSPFPYVYRPYAYRPYSYRPFVYSSHGIIPVRRRGLSPTTPSRGGVGPRLRIPQGTLLTRRTAGTFDVPTRTASFPLRDRNDRPSDRGMPSARPSDRGDAARGWDRPAAPERREGGGSVARPAPPRGRDPGVSGGGRSSGGRGWSAPRASGGGRAAPANRGGGGGRRH